MHRRWIALAAVLAAGCGGEGEGKDVKDSLNAFATSAEVGDGQDYCAGITPESRDLLDTLAEGRLGPEGNCSSGMEDLLGQDSDFALSSEEVEAIDEADVDIEGGVARVKAEGDDERIPLRKQGDDWLVDLANAPTVGYTLNVSATCTKAKIEGTKKRLPPPTRRGIASEAELDVAFYEDLLRATERTDPPKGKEREHERFVRALRENRRTWQRATKSVQGLGEPIDTYNKALLESEKRITGVKKEQEALGVGCGGDAQALEPAADFARSATKICTDAGKRVEALPEDAGPRGFTRIAARTARDLATVSPPDDLAPLYRASVRAFGQAARSLSRARDEKDLERFQLRALRGAIGFIRLGLPRCGEL